MFIPIYLSVYRFIYIDIYSNLNTHRCIYTYIYGQNNYTCNLPGTSGGVTYVLSRTL